MQNATLCIRVIMFLYFLSDFTSDRKALAYSVRDITLTLPSSISATDLKWLSMFCIAYNHNFGEVTFPANLNVPPSMEVGK